MIRFRSKHIDQLDTYTLSSNKDSYFDVLLTVHLSIFISVFNQLDAQNKFYFMPLHVSRNFDLLLMSTCARNM